MHCRPHITQQRRAPLTVADAASPAQWDAADSNTVMAASVSAVASSSAASVATVAGWCARPGHAFTAAMASAVRPSLAASWATMALDSLLSVGCASMYAWCTVQVRTRGRCHIYSRYPTPALRPHSSSQPTYNVDTASLALPPWLA